MIDFVINIPMELKVIFLAGLFIALLDYVKTKLKQLVIVKDKKDAEKGRR